MRALLVGIALLLILVPPSVFATMTCVVRNSACMGTEAEMFRLSAPANAHAEGSFLPDTNGYDWKVCCDNPISPGTVSRACNAPDDVAFHFSSSTNAHAEQADQSAYTGAEAFTVCASSTAGGISADCLTTAGSCPVGYACLATLSSPTNAHVGDCVTAPYSTKVCCTVESDPFPPVLTFTCPTPPQDGIATTWTSPPCLLTTTHTNTVLVNVTANEPLASCSMELSLGGSPIQNVPGTLYANGLGCTVLFTSLVDGDYTVLVTATDASPIANVGTATRDFTVETDYPTSTITQPLNGQLFNGATWVGSIQGTAFDTQDGIANVKLSIANKVGDYWNGASWQSALAWLTASGTTSWTYAFAATHGQFTVQSNATDTAGKVEQPPLPAVTFSIDVQLPSAAIDPSAKLNGATTGAPTYTGAATDAALDTYTSGTQKVEYRLSDEIACGTPPCFGPPGGWTESGVSYTQGNPPPAELVTVDFAADLGAINPGLHKIEVRATDYAGNVQQPPYDFDTFIFNTLAPSISITAPLTSKSPYTAAKWVADTPIKGTAADAGAITLVEVQVQRDSDGLYWNGAAWVAATTWLAATDTSGIGIDWTTWKYPAAGIYTPDADGQYTVRARATNSIPLTTADTEIVIYDTTPPFVELAKLPPWTTKPYINVSWTGSDAFGVKNFLIQYNETDGPSTVWSSWKDWLSSNEQAPGGVNFAPALNNHTFHFLATATDLAGNVNTSNVVRTTVDLEPPACTITPFPSAYAKTPLTIAWTVQEDESGVGSLGVWMQSINPPSPKFHINDLAPFFCNAIGPASTSTICTTLAEGVLELTCAVNDTAGNVGPTSAPETVTIDLTPPQMGTFIQPAKPWANTVPFILQWNVTDDAGSGFDSGIAFANVEWSDVSAAGPWQNVTASGTFNLLTTAVSWGDDAIDNGDPLKASIAEGDTFWFRARGKDNVGWTGVFTAPPFNVTIDTIPPTITVVARDQTGAILTDPVLAGVVTVNITSTATDAGSGIAVHRIWAQWTDNGIFVTSQDCGPSEYCELVIPVGSKDEIVYWAEATDVAGNKAETPQVVLATHPLANFVTEDVLLVLGSSAILDVQVRNLAPAKLDTLTLTLSGYQPAGFIAEGGEGDFTDYTILAGGAGVQIENLQAGGRGTFKVQVISSDPEDSSDLNLTAVASSGLTDKDVAHVSIGLPASFSGLTDWAILLLVALAGLVYYRASRPAQGRKGAGAIFFLIVLIFLIVAFFFIINQIDFSVLFAFG